jgi:hypothetical protein
VQFRVLRRIIESPFVLTDSLAVQAPIE